MTDSETPASKAPERPDPRPALAALRGSRGRWRLLAFLAIAIAVIALVARFALPGQGETDRIARVVISGVIATNADRLKTLTHLANDNHVKAVLVEINSPGGTTAGGEELYEALSAIRAKKPVVVTIAELGASAAYMTAVAADRIYARHLSLVGSIGVYMQHIDAKKLMDTIGIGYDKVQTGPLKGEPDINKPLAGPVRESFQALVDDSFAWFEKIVAERRHLDPAEMDALGDGRILTGQMAFDAKLVDAFGGEPEALGWLEDEKGLSPDLPVITYYPKPPSGWAAVLRETGASAVNGALQAVGLGASREAAAANALDGLVSLWHLG